MADGARRRQELGFTLIELMVVVLIMAILLSIAIPTFLGARERANNRAAQSNLRNALTNELVVYADNQGFTDDPMKLNDVDNSVGYTNNRPAMVATPRTIYVEVRTTTTANDTVILGAKSSNGDCFWIRNVGDTNLPRFAQNNCTLVPTTYVDAW